MDDRPSLSERHHYDMKLDDHAFSGVMVGGGETDEFSFARYTYAKKAAVDFEE